MGCAGWRASLQEADVLEHKNGQVAESDRLASHCRAFPGSCGDGGPRQMEGTQEATTPDSVGGEGQRGSPGCNQHNLLLHWT